MTKPSDFILFATFTIIGLFTIYFSGINKDFWLTLTLSFYVFISGLFLSLMKFLINNIDRIKNKIKTSYINYKQFKEKRELLIAFPYILVFIIAIVSAVIEMILLGIYHLLLDVIEEQKRRNEINRIRQNELRHIYEYNRAAGHGFESGVIRAKNDDIRRKQAQRQADKNFREMFRF